MLHWYPDCINDEQHYITVLTLDELPLTFELCEFEKVCILYVCLFVYVLKTQYVLFRVIFSTAPGCEYIFFIELHSVHTIMITIYDSE